MKGRRKFLRGKEGLQFATASLNEQSHFCGFRSLWRTGLEQHRWRELYFCVSDAQRGQYVSGEVTQRGGEQLTFRTSHFKFRLGASLLHPSLSLLEPGHPPALCGAWLL